MNRKQRRRTDKTRARPSGQAAASDAARREFDQAVSLYRAKRFAEAEAACRRALEISPAYVAAHNNLGVMFEAQGKLSDAAEAYRRAIELDPNDAKAHNNLGVVYGKRGARDDALAAYRRAIELDPGFAMAHNNLGNVFYETDRPDEAVAAFERAIALKPDYAEAHCSLGNTLKAQGRLDQAAAAYDRAIALQPGWAIAHSNLGTVFQEQGKPDQAVACYEKAVALKPDLAPAFHKLAQIRTYRADDPQVDAMKALLERPHVSSVDRSLLLFGLGVVHDKLARFDEAFGYFSEANRIARQDIDYDSSENADTTGRIIEAFGPSTFAGRGDFGHPSDVPIFIVGMPRSGKTLVERILGNHPGVCVARETYELDRIVSVLPGRLGGGLSFPECVEALTPAEAGELGESYVAALRSRSPEALRITNTRPRNFQLLGLVRLILPRARIIHCTRDPLDNCLYCFIKNYRTQRFAFDLAELGAYFLQYRRLMNHWRDVLQTPILEVRYEQLVGDPEKVGREIYTFCDLDWQATFAARSEPASDGRGPRAAQSPLDLETSELGASRRYEAHLEPLKRILQGSVVGQGK